MNEISAMASSSISMMQVRMQEQIGMSILRDNAESVKIKGRNNVLYFISIFYPH